MLWQPSTVWDPAAYSLHWQSIPLAELRVDESDVNAAADVSLVSGKVSYAPHVARQWADEACTGMLTCDCTGVLMRDRLGSLVRDGREQRDGCSACAHGSSGCARA
jgi:hypothetical protein